MSNKYPTIIFLIALVITLPAHGQPGPKSTTPTGTGVKLLDSIAYNSGNYTLFNQKFEYDSRHRIVKMTSASDGKAITLAYKDNDLVSVQGESVKKSGNTITFGKETITINPDGYMVKKERRPDDGKGGNYVTTYQYRSGNLIKRTDTQVGESGQSVAEYKYDDKKSPFASCRTPKWFLVYQLGGYGLKNNITEFVYASEFVHNNKPVKEMLEHFVYSFEYGSDGYPTKETHSEMGEEEVSFFIYRGEGGAKQVAAKEPPKPAEANAQGAFTDSRDGQKYKTVNIGGQLWMAENHNVKTENSWCYGGDEANCKKYGRLYTWDAARKACSGMGGKWRLPTREGWDKLVNIAGGEKVAGKKLKSKSGWDRCYYVDDEEGEVCVENGNGTDNYGFSGLPGGVRDEGIDGDYRTRGTTGIWWSEKGDDTGYAYRLYMSHDDDKVGGNSYSKLGGFSVRCVSE